MTWWCTGSSLFCCPPFSIVTNNSKDQLDKSALCVTYNRIRAMDACGASTVHSSLPLSTVTSVLTWCLVCFVLCFYFRFWKKEKKGGKNPPTAPDRFAQTWFNCIFSRHTNMVTAMINKKGETKLYFQTGILFITCCLTLPDNTECHSFSLKFDYFSGSKAK